MNPIDQIKDEISALPAYQKRLNELLTRIRKQESEAAGLLHSYEAESQDVEKMQKESFSAFLLRLLGKYEDRLEQEKQEEIAAKLVYDAACIHLDELRKTERELRVQINDLERKRQAYDQELSHRRELLRARLVDPEAQAFHDLENERQQLNSQLVEINEAFRVAGRAISIAEATLGSLSKAEDWATYDAFTRGGLLSHSAKYSHIDEAESNFHRLHSLLRELKKEVEDVQAFPETALLEVSTSEWVMDFWFDNIFTDLSVRRTIGENMEKVQGLMEGIVKIRGRLSARQKACQARLESNRYEEEQLLLHMKPV